MENLPDTLTVSFVDIEAGWHDQELGAFLQRHENRHRRAATELPRFVIRGRQHTPPTTPSNTNRLAAQCGVVPLLDGGVKAIHIDMDDLADGALLHA